MKLLSHNGYLLVRPIKKEEKNVSGIIIVQDTSADDEQIANGVVVIGSDKFSVDTVVYFNKLIPADIHLKEGDKENQFFALQEADIMFSETK